MAAKFKTYEEMVAQAGKDYANKATGDALAAGLQPYAPTGQTVRSAIKDNYNAKVKKVAADFAKEWGVSWRGHVFA